MTEQELLAVLDMSEEKQYYWCAEYFKDIFAGSLACLAFRLRDEADDTRMHNAMYLVQQSMSKTSSTPQPEDYATAFWGLYHAKPIHWVIASLIAKGETK